MSLEIQIESHEPRGPRTFLLTDRFAQQHIHIAVSYEQAAQRTPEPWVWTKVFYRWSIYGRVSDIVAYYQEPDSKKRTPKTP